MSGSLEWAAKNQDVDSDRPKKRTFGEKLRQTSDENKAEIQTKKWVEEVVIPELITLAEQKAEEGEDYVEVEFSGDCIPEKFDNITCQEEIESELEDVEVDVGNKKKNKIKITLYW